MFNEAAADAVNSGSLNTFWNYIYNNPNIVQKEVPFDPSWANGTGYFNGAALDTLPGVEVGEIVRSRANVGADKRRLLIVKTRFGNVVLFERYNAPDGVLTGPIVHHEPRLVKLMGVFDPASGPLTLKEVIDALGDCNCNMNVALRIEQFFNAMRKFEKTGVVHQ